MCFGVAGYSAVKPRWQGILQLSRDKNGSYILAEALVEGEKFVFLNIYGPNDQTQQMQFQRGLSNSVLNKYAGEPLVLGVDLKLC